MPDFGKKIKRELGVQKAFFLEIYTDNFAYSEDNDFIEQHLAGVMLLQILNDLNFGNVFV